jgi:hypothetical protein
VSELCSAQKNCRQVMTAGFFPGSVRWGADAKIVTAAFIRSPNLLLSFGKSCGSTEIDSTPHQFPEREVLSGLMPALGPSMQARVADLLYTES